ncbi:unnamed protein product [Calypogeia fissa]
MTTNGTGSGVDILKRMEPGGSLDGGWVMFDIMHRCTGGWLTFSAHIYDHHLRALSTIFTCELKAQDAESQETAWRLMVDIAKRHGVREVTIKGFMADNAEAGWQAVRRVFFNGKPKPTRERSDLFHFKQSFVRHAKEGVPFNKREEHERMWERMKNAPNMVLAYRIKDEITDWWMAGNCVEGKLMMLMCWIAWWVIRWRQWANWLRRTKDAMENALMPNCTGSESVHASM